MVEEVENQEEEKKEEIQPVVPEGQLKATRSGWAPKDDWKGDPDDWVDYREFNFRGELMDRVKEQSSIINHLTDKNKETKQTLDDLASLQGKIADREYNKALKDLQEQKIAAVDESDGRRVVEIDEEIDELKGHKKVLKEEPSPPPVPQDTPPEIIAWMQQSENQWYNQNKFLQGVADTAAREIMAGKPGIPPADLLREMDAKVKKEMPQYFKTAPASPVDAGGDYSSRPAGRGKKPTFNDLDDDQKQVARRFERMGTMKIDEYIEGLVEIGEL